MGVVYLSSHRQDSERSTQSLAKPESSESTFDNEPYNEPYRDELLNIDVLPKPTYPKVFVETLSVAGVVNVTEVAPFAWRVNLNGKTILEDCDSIPPEIISNFQVHIAPFDSVIVLHRAAQGTYYEGGTFWFLGVNRDGSFYLSQDIGKGFAHFPTVSLGRDYVKVSVRGGYGNNALPGEPYLPGGTWILKNGHVLKLKSRQAID
jgi:hypothetical protein